VVNPDDDPRYGEYWRLYHDLMGRRGITPAEARTLVRTDTTAIAALMVKRGEADAMLCGAQGRYGRHLRHVLDIVGRRPGVGNVSALSILIMNRGTLFLCDTHVSPDPTAEQIAEMAIMAADEMARIGIPAKAALLSHSDFGSADTPSARKMRQALMLIRERSGNLEIDGEMNADTALDTVIRERIFPGSHLEGAANLLIFPNQDAANIGMNLLKSAGDGLLVGPLLLGAAAPAHILTPSITARGLLNATALAVVDAQQGESLEAAHVPGNLPPLPRQPTELTSPE
jgi:malate dehydrogenase (oxaloacetate-decarboxylating)(NADP+)